MVRAVAVAVAMLRGLGHVCASGLTRCPPSSARRFEPTACGWLIMRNSLVTRRRCSGLALSAPGTPARFLIARGTVHSLATLATGPRVREIGSDLASCWVSVARLHVAHRRSTSTPRCVRVTHEAMPWNQPQRWFRPAKPARPRTLATRCTPAYPAHAGLSATLAGVREGGGGGEGGRIRAGRRRRGRA